MRCARLLAVTAVLEATFYGQFTKHHSFMFVVRINTIDKNYA